MHGSGSATAIEHAQQPHAMTSTPVFLPPAPAPEAGSAAAAMDMAAAPPTAGSGGGGSDGSSGGGSVDGAGRPSVLVNVNGNGGAAAHEGGADGSPGKASLCVCASS